MNFYLEYAVGRAVELGGQPTMPEGPTRPLGGSCWTYHGDQLMHAAIVLRRGVGSDPGPDCAQPASVLRTSSSTAALREFIGLPRLYARSDPLPRTRDWVGKLGEHYDCL
jgi:hypothetical protein